TSPTEPLEPEEIRKFIDGPLFGRLLLAARSPARRRDQVKLCATDPPLHQDGARSRRLSRRAPRTGLERLPLPRGLCAASAPQSSACQLRLQFKVPCRSNRERELASLSNTYVRIVELHHLNSHINLIVFRPGHGSNRYAREQPNSASRN